MFIDHELSASRPIGLPGIELDLSQDDLGSLYARPFDLAPFVPAIQDGQGVEFIFQVTSQFTNGSMAIKIRTADTEDMAGSFLYWDSGNLLADNFYPGRMGGNLPSQPVFRSGRWFTFPWPSILPQDARRWVQLYVTRTVRPCTGALVAGIPVTPHSKDFAELGL